MTRRGLSRPTFAVRVAHLVGPQRQAEITPKMPSPSSTASRKGRCRSSRCTRRTGPHPSWRPCTSAPAQRQRRRQTRRDEGRDPPTPTRRRHAPKAGDRLTPYTDLRVPGQFREGDGVPAVLLLSRVPGGRQARAKCACLKPDHPITKDYGEVQVARDGNVRRAVPRARTGRGDSRRTWASGEWFRSRMVWTIGKGRVFYFRPGHETFPVFKGEAGPQLLRTRFAGSLEG